MTHLINVKEKLHFDALVKGEKGFIIIKPERRIFEDDTIILQCHVEHWFANEDKKTEITKEKAIELAGPGKDGKPQIPPYDTCEDYEKAFIAIELATDDELPGLKAGWQAISLKEKGV